MNRTVRVAIVGAWLVAPSLRVQAQETRVELPTIRFHEPPTLVTVEPGIQVVPDQPEELFYVDGWYWTRDRDHWFRTHDYRGQWVVADLRIIPDRLAKVPEGRYRNWHKESR